MKAIEYADMKISVDDEGYLVNSDDWNEKVACALAENEGIEELTPDMIEILKFMRDYYARYNIFPILGGVCRNVHQPKNCVREKFIEPLKAWKLSGLPKPSEQIIGYLEGKGGVV
jgi:tRNA 2-thiouridine synthesizing protein E